MNKYEAHMLNARESLSDAVHIRVGLVVRLRCGLMYRVTNSLNDRYWGRNSCIFSASPDDLYSDWYWDSEGRFYGYLGRNSRHDVVEVISE